MKLALGRLGSAGTRTLIQRAIASLRARGTDAHLWLPGGDVKTYGPELVTNGGFDSSMSGWTNTGSTAVSTNSKAEITATANFAGIGQAIATVPGRVYRITTTIVSPFTGGKSSYLSVGTSAFGTQLLNSYLVGSSAGATADTTFTATTTSSYPNLIGGGTVASDVSIIDNISVREITSITSTITSGLTTGNYLESTGNTVATVNNPVGLVLDALGTVGSELVTNGGFDSDTGWTKEASWAIGSGVASKTAGVAGSIYQSAPTGLAQNTYCRVTFTATRTAGTCYFFLRDTDSTLAVNASGTYSVMVKAGANSAYGINIYAAADFTGSIDNISVREVTGIHLTQATTQNKAIVQRGLWNLLTYSNTFSNVSWTKENSAITATGIDDPFGGTSAVTLTCSVGGGGIYHTITGVSATNAMWIRRRTGAGVINMGGMLGTYNAVAVDGTWQLFVSTTLQTGTYGGLVQIATAGDAIDICYGGCFQGTLTAQQILAAGGIPVTTTAAGSNPDSGRYAWRFDGSNDSLALGSVPFNTQDDICVVAGTAIAADYANGAKIFGIRSANGNSIINLTIDASNTLVAQFRDESLAMLLAASSGNAFSGGVPLVASARKVGSTAIIRANSVTLGTTTLAVGASAFGANLPNIGSENATKYFKGSIGPVLAIKGTVTDAELLMYERLVAALTPGAPTF